jgi:hypothetical protein
MLENLFSHLENSYLFDKKHDTVLCFIEAALGLVAGGFLSSFISNYNTRDLIFSLLFLVLFGYLFYRRTSKDKSFKVSALGELKSTISLESATKDIERKILIDGYIDEAVKSLNSNTCNYNEFNAESHLCDQSLSNGLQSVYRPYFDNLQNLLVTPQAKFTVGAYLNYFLKLPAEFGKEPKDPLEDYDVFIPKDDFGFGNLFIKDILTNLTLTDLPFFFQHQFQDSFKHQRFIHNTFEANDKEYSLMTAPIPTVCEDGSTGVFFMISESLNNIPSDIDTVTLIFSRLFSNWLSKYNDCLDDRCSQMNSMLFEKKGAAVTTPPEVQDLHLKTMSGNSTEN